MKSSDAANSWFGLCARCNKPCVSLSWPSSLCPVGELGLKQADSEGLWKQLG